MGVVIRPESIPRPSLARGFSQVLRRHAGSPAYAELARRIQGFSGPGFGLLDAEQLAQVLEALAASPGDRMADLGCGLGVVAERVSASVGGAGLRMIGIDLAVGALAVGRHRHPDPSFAAADLIRLPFPSAHLDGLIAVDSLYFLPDPDLDQAVAEASRVLTAGGRLVAVASELLPRPGERPADRTRLARALHRAGLPWKAHDLTALEEAFWRRRARELPRLEGDFAAEGHRDLWRALADETERGLNWSRERRIRRYLYRATRPPEAAVEAPDAAATWHGDSR